MGVCGSNPGSRAGPLNQAQSHSMVKQWMIEAEMYRDGKLQDIKTKDKSILDIAEDQYQIDRKADLLKTHAVSSLKLKKEILILNFAIQCFKSIDGNPAAFHEYVRKPDHPAAYPVLSHVYNLVYIGTKFRSPQVNQFLDLVRRTHGENEVVKANNSEEVKDSLKEMIKSLGREPEHPEIADYVSELQRSVQKSK